MNSPVASSHKHFTEPTRFRVIDGAPLDRAGYIARAYCTLIIRHLDNSGRLTMSSLAAVLRDPDVGKQLRYLSVYASTVLPEPAPDAATLGIVIDCWRTSEIENVHAGNPELSDVIMAKLNITMTRAVRRCITKQRVDWRRVHIALTRSDRKLPDGRTVAQLLGPDWPKVQGSVQDRLAKWLAIEAVVGAEATVAMVAATGSTSYTARWWGTSWWPKLAGQVFDHVLATNPEAIGNPAAVEAGTLRQALIEEPDTLPDSILAALIDPPDHQGLRSTPLEPPELKTMPAEFYFFDPNQLDYEFAGLYEEAMTFDSGWRPATRPLRDRKPRR